MRRFSLAVLCGLLAPTIGCGSSDNTTGSGTASSSSSSSSSSGAGGSGGAGAGGGGGAGGGAAPRCTMPTAVKCSDQVALQMNLQPTPTKGAIGNTADGAGWKSTIDATAGGAFAPKPESFTYGKFTDKGLEKVSISDDDSLTSMAWDIAFRRYVVRINSGFSGPSCVAAARTQDTVKYETLDKTPPNLDFKTDQYFTDEPDCMLIPDGSGLMNSPATALSSYWTYQMCVKMSGRVFVIQLADGKNVKLIVDDYYTPKVQDQCNQTGSIPMMGTGSANFIVRWAYIP